MPSLPAIPLLAPLVATLLSISPPGDHRPDVPARRDDPGIQERQAEVLRRAREGAPAPLVFVGDSITQGWEGPGAEVWKDRFAPIGAINLGVSGDRTEHVLWRLAEAPVGRLRPRAIVLLLGTNNLGHGTANAEQTFDGLAKVVETLLVQAPEATVIVCGIFPRDGRFAPIRGDLLSVNQAIAARFAREPRVRTLDFGWRFLAPDAAIPKGLMPDGLHLSPEGYAIWADAVLPVVRELVTPSR